MFISVHSGSSPSANKKFITIIFYRAEPSIFIPTFLYTAQQSPLYLHFSPAKDYVRTTRAVQWLVIYFKHIFLLILCYYRRCENSTLKRLTIILSLWRIEMYLRATSEPLLTRYGFLKCPFKHIYFTYLTFIIGECCCMYLLFCGLILVFSMPTNIFLFKWHRHYNIQFWFWL